MYRKAKKGDFDKLEKICDDFSHMVKQGYLNGALEADMKFHEMLIEMSENEKLKQVYMSSHIPLFHQKLGKTQSDINDYEQTDKEHRLIVKSLKDRKLSVAEETLMRHFARGEAVVMDLS
jgi:DNA-binding GntR family transcriptional regulator